MTKMYNETLLKSIVKNIFHYGIYGFEVGNMKIPIYVAPHLIWGTRFLEINNLNDIRMLSAVGRCRMSVFTIFMFRVKYGQKKVRNVYIGPNLLFPKPWSTS